MKVLFDAFWWMNGPPSGRSVVRGIVSAWAKQFPDDDIMLLVRKKDLIQVQEELISMSIEATLHGTRIPNHAMSNLFLSSSSNVDVFVSQNFTPLFNKSLTKIPFVHDLIYKSNSEWFTKNEKIYLSLIEFSAKQADLIVTSSFTEAARIRTQWPHIDAPVKAVGLAAPDWVERTSEELTGTTPKRTKPYLLTVGRLNARKNLRTLTEAFEQSDLQNTHDLYVVGEPDGKSAELRPSSSSIVFLPGLSDPQLAGVYKGAVALAFPSLDEGFGLPLLEGAFFNLPIAASDIDVFREIGIADQYFDPYSRESIIEALEALVRESPSQDKQKQVRRYTWNHTARRIRESIVENRSGI